MFFCSVNVIRYKRFERLASQLTIETETPIRITSLFSAGKKVLDYCSLWMITWTLHLCNLLIYYYTHASSFAILLFEAWDCWLIFTSKERKNVIKRLSHICIYYLNYTEMKYSTLTYWFYLIYSCSTGFSKCVNIHPHRGIADPPPHRQRWESWYRRIEATYSTFVSSFQHPVHRRFLIDASSEWDWVEGCDEIGCDCCWCWCRQWTNLQHSILWFCNAFPFVLKCTILCHTGLYFRVFSFQLQSVLACFYLPVLLVSFQIYLF